MLKINNKNFKHKAYLDFGSKVLIFMAALLGIVITFFIIVFIVYQSVPVFQRVGFWHFIFSRTWQVDASRNIFEFGALGFIASTLLVVFIAMLIAIPLSIFTSVLISEFLSKKIKKLVIFLIELLAGVPPVVFGIFGIRAIGKLYQQVGASSPANLLTASSILALMALPTIVALICNALNSVPSSYRFASLAMGVSRTSTAFQVVRKAVRTKIIGAIAFGICRVIGEVTAMVMVTGLVYQMPNFQEGFLGFIFSGVATLASVIGVELPETAASIHTSALFALGLILIIFVSILNLIILATYKVNKNQARGVSYSKKFKIFVVTKILKRSLKPAKEHEIKEQELLKYYHLTPNLKWAKNFTKFKDYFLIFLMTVSTILTLTMVFWIIGDVVVKGMQAVIFLTPNRAMLKGVYELPPIIVSTLLLIVCSLILAIPFGILGGIYLSEYAKKNSFIANLIRFCVDALVATPSAVFGMFGYIAFVKILGIGHNFISAGLMFAVLTLPIIIKNTEEALSNVSQEDRDSSLALGTSKIGMVFKIVIPNSKKGIITGIFFAMSKVISESLPVLLTLSASPFMPGSLLDSGTTLTVKIFQIFNEPDLVAGAAHFMKVSAFVLANHIAYELALITITLIIALNLFVRYFTREKQYQSLKTNYFKGVLLWLQTKRKQKLVPIGLQK